MHANSLWAIAAMKGLDKMSTPYGTVFQKQTTPKVVKNDEDALLKWVQENLPDAIVKVPKLDMRILSEMIDKLGIDVRTIPGMMVIEPVSPTETQVRLKEAL